MEYIFFIFGIIYFIVGVLGILLGPIIKFIVQMLVFIKMDREEQEKK